RMPLSLKLVRSARQTPTRVAVGPEAPAERVAALRGAGVGIIASETVNGRIALPELLDDLAARGISTLMVEGGAAVADSFLSEGLVDRLVLFTSPLTVGDGGIAAPGGAFRRPANLARREAWRFGDDLCEEWTCSPGS
ncbi:MAG: RibD family protein, partial [Rhizobiaceae bacterium]